MIARQRQNLSRTFAAKELGNASKNTIARLKKAQEELLDATSEFATGAEEFGTIGPMHDAAQQMEQAVQDLASADLTAGTSSEENALAALIRARKNLKKMLAAKGGSSASQCRSFDYQQKQKLRTPEEMLKESGEQLAQKCEQLDQLAQEQRKWSEEVRQRVKGGPELDKKPPQQSQSSGGKQSSSSQQQQAAQQKSLDQLQQLAKNLNQSTDTSDATQQRLDEAVSQIEDSIEALRKDEPEQAAAQAEQAAEKLDEVSDHLATLNEADFAQQLGAASRMAQRLADQQSELASKMPGGDSGSPSGSSAGEQRRLAESAELMSDLFSRMQGASLDEDRETQAALKELAGSNPPGEIAGLMKDAADDLDAAKDDSAARSAGLAAKDLKDLASGLRQIRNGYSQPRLDELIAAEAHAAELLSGVKRSDSENDLALLQSKLGALQNRLDQLAQWDTRLSQAVSGMPNGSGKPSSKPSTQQSNGQSGNGSGSAGDGESTGFRKSQRVMADGVREIGQVLQKRIQEVILSGALSGENAAVPPEYQQLVEEYYRTLSDDLR